MRIYRSCFFAVCPLCMVTAIVIPTILDMYGRWADGTINFLVSERTQLLKRIVAKKQT